MQLEEQVKRQIDCQEESDMKALEAELVAVRNERGIIQAELTSLQVSQLPLNLIFSYFIPSVVYWWGYIYVYHNHVDGALKLMHSLPLTPIG